MFKQTRAKELLILDHQTCESELFSFKKKKKKKTGKTDWVGNLSQLEDELLAYNLACLSASKNIFSETVLDCSVNQNQIPCEKKNVNNDQEMALSERTSHFKNQVGKAKLAIRYLYKEYI